MNSVNCVIRLIKQSIPDPVGAKVSEEARHLLGLNPGKIRCAKIFFLPPTLSAGQVQEFAEKGLKDAVLHELFFRELPKMEGFASGILIAKKPGVTDDEGISAQKTLEDLLNIPFSGRQEIFTQDFYYIEKCLPENELLSMAREFLANELIHHVEVGPDRPQLSYFPEVHLQVESSQEYIDLHIPDVELLAISRTRLLSLNLEEMKAIQGHFAGQGIRKHRIKAGLAAFPSECELEILGQTWSEHCKHKEFAGVITFTDHDTGEVKTIDSLFSTYIRGATQQIIDSHKKQGIDWIVKVFSDNAGAVKIDHERLFIWKVETHNSPSALDPYGGSLTGIVGNNRDPLGTGVGGARLLFNTDVLCFAPPDFAGTLFPGQLHPRKIMRGVRRGIEDGGNKSGIPTVNGAVVFDERFRAKPLVYCGTGAVLPMTYQGKPSWVKEIDPGDLIVMAGGRVGKDGIHGATFSSAEMDEGSPQTAVQIGSPITQKFLADFLENACVRGLVKCSTDNGAGGLSSSIGELALIPGGALVQLEKVPLKYPGLKPWEIFVSESQERMTLAVSPEKWPDLLALAKTFEVELSNIGLFSNSGYLDVRFDQKPIALLRLTFLHDGVPRKHLEAEWKTPEISMPDISGDMDIGKVLLDLLGSWNICSRETLIRQYDHEVKGRTVVKPLMGPRGIAPQDAAVVRFGFDSFLGVAVSNGICPKFADGDPYAMSAGAFDEAVRQIICVGGKLPGNYAETSRFWSGNDNFCVPDSVYDPVNNPDGKIKLGQLVKMCQALFDLSTFFGIPMTSGKDSMKNDFRHGTTKISVPPTVLYSLTARMDDVRLAVTSEFKRPGDLIYLIGETFDEMGGTEFSHLLGLKGGKIPQVRKEQAKERYLKFGKAHDQKLFESCHDCSDGGFAVALAESAFGGNLGCTLDVGNLNRLNSFNMPLPTLMFSESHSRFLVSVDPSKEKNLTSIFGDDVIFLGKVQESPKVCLQHQGKTRIDLSIADLFSAWNRGLDR